MMIIMIMMMILVMMMIIMDDDYHYAYHNLDPFATKIHRVFCYHVLSDALYKGRSLHILV